MKTHFKMLLVCVCGLINRVRYWLHGEW